MRLNTHVFFDHGDLSPLDIRQDLIDAVAAGEVSFPKGTTEQSLLPWIWTSGWIHGSGGLDGELINSRYGSFEPEVWGDFPPLKGFPLTGVLELLERIGHGEHPRFVAAAWDLIGELMDPAQSPDGTVDIVFLDDPQY